MEDFKPGKRELVELVASFWRRGRLDPAISGVVHPQYSSILAGYKNYWGLTTTTTTDRDTFRLVANFVAAHD
jgi:hypothetical protein